MKILTHSLPGSHSSLPLSLLSGEVGLALAIHFLPCWFFFPPFPLSMTSTSDVDDASGRSTNSTCLDHFFRGRSADDSESFEGLFSCAVVFFLHFCLLVAIEASLSSLWLALLSGLSHFLIQLDWHEVGGRADFPLDMVDAEFLGMVEDGVPVYIPVLFLLLLLLMFLVCVLTCWYLVFYFYPSCFRHVFWHSNTFSFVVTHCVFGMCFIYTQMDFNMELAGYDRLWLVTLNFFFSV